MCDKKTQIEKFLDKHKHIYIEIDNEISMTYIHNLLINNVVFEDSNDIETYYLGHYYKIIKKDYVTMKKYYLKSIDNGNDNAMNNLAKYYCDIEKNYKLAKKYFLMAIDKNNGYAINGLALYYQNVEKDYVLAKKYLLMGENIGNVNAITNLGYFYQNIEINYDLMKKYYEKAIEKGCKTAILNLCIYYQTIELNDKMAKKYYARGCCSNITQCLILLHNYYKKINKEHKIETYMRIMCVMRNVTAMELLGHYYENKNNTEEKIKYYSMAIENNSVNGYIHNSVGIYYMEKKDYKLAKKCYVNGIKYNHKESINNLGVYYLIKQKDEKAIDYFLLSNTPEGIYNIITIYAKDKRYIKMLDVYINNPHIVPREIIIEYFNFVIDKDLSNIEKQSFTQIVKNFEFNDCDKVSNALKIIIEM